MIGGVQAVLTAYLGHVVDGLMKNVIAIVSFLILAVCAWGQTCSAPTPVFSPPVIPAGETQPIELNGFQTLPGGYGPNQSEPALQNFAMASSIYGASGFPWVDCTALIFTTITGTGTFLGINANSNEGGYVLYEIGLTAGQDPTVVNQWSMNAANVQPPISGQQPLIDWDHEAIRLPNGWTAVIGHEEMMVTSTTQCPTAQFPTNYCDVLGDKIVVMDTAGTVEWVWDSFNASQFPYLSRRAILGETCTASDAGGTCPITLATVAQDWLHANSLWYDPADGNIVINLRNQDWIVKVAYQNGAGNGSVVWRLGNEGDFTTEVTNQQFPWEDHPHDITSPSPGVYCMFDNGNGRHASNEALSRGLVYTINESAREVTAMQVYPLGVYSPGSGAAQLLANGNWMFMAGRPQNPSGIYSEQFEFAPSGSVPLWTETLPQQYRETRLSGLFYLINNSLASDSAVVSNAAGSGTVLLISGAPWTATSNTPWLQIAPGSTSGVGSALIQFSYSGNSNPGAQTGTLTIGGLTFTVTQAGAAYVPATPVNTLISSGLNNPQGVAVDGQGNLYIADTAHSAIKEWSPVSQQTVVLSSAQNKPAAVAVDGQGNVYIADTGNHAIEEFSAANQQLTTLVSGLSNPSGVAVDGQGNVYFSDTSNNAIDEWNVATQQVVTLADSGLSNPTGVAVDAQGNVYFADTGNNSIKEWVAALRQVMVLASSGLNNPTGVAVDGQGNVYIADTGHNAIKQWNAGSQQVAPLISSGLNSPMGVAADGQGNIYVADTNNSAIRNLTPCYVALSVNSLNESAQAGTGTVTAQALPANLPLIPTSDQPWLTVTGAAGGVIGFSFQANTSGAARVAHITILGVQVTVTQSGDAPAGVAKCAGDAQGAPVGQPFATALEVCVTDANGNPLSGWPVTFIVAPGAAGAGGTFSTIPPMPVLTNAGGIATAPTLTANGVSGQFTVSASVNQLTVTFSLNNIFTSTAYTLATNSALVGSAAGNETALLITSGPWTAVSNASWLQIAPGSASGLGSALIQFSYSANSNAGPQTGTLTIAGLTFTVVQAGASYLPVTAVTTPISSGLNNPKGVAVDGQGNLYIADTGNNVIKKASPGAQQAVVLSSAQNNPGAVAVDGQGNVYIADSGNHAIEELSSANQQLTTLISGLSNPSGIAVDGQGNVYFSDTSHNAIDEWNATTLQVTTLAGSGLSNPTGVAVDALGDVYFADSGNNTIKEWTAPGGQVTVLVSSGLNNPTGVAVDGQGNVYIADTGSNAIKQWNAGSPVTTLLSAGLNSPMGVAVDGKGNIYVADTDNSAIKQLTPGYLALSASSLSEPAQAGTDSVTVQSLPASIPLTATSDQSWLTITSIVGGTVNFSFTTASSALSRTGHITVLGPEVTVTQSGLLAQTIAFEPLANQPFGSAPFTVSATASSGLPVSFVSITSTVCTVSGATVTLVFGGTCTIQAAQAGNSTYAAAPPVNQSFQVTPVSQTITFGTLSSQRFGTPPFPVSATASSGLPVSFASTTPATCSVTGANVTLVSVGTCTIQATQAGNASYTAAAPVNRSFQVMLGLQTITFGALSNQVFGTPPFPVDATASSGLAVSFDADTPAVCAVSGSTVTLVATGNCTIEASQPGNTNWARATPVSQSFQVTKESQTINFGALSSQPFGTPPFIVSATASSGLAVSFTATSPAFCTVSGSTVTLVAAGSCTIRATQSGNADWSAATPVNQSFQVTKGSQTINFGSIPNQTLGTPPFTVNATASSGLAVNFGSLTPKVCTVSGSTVTLSAAGTCEIKATQPGNANWAAATPVTQSFQVQ